MIWCFIRLFLLVIIGNDLRTAHPVFEGESLLNLDIHAVAQSGDHSLAGIGLLVGSTADEIDEGRVATKLDGTLRYGDDL